MTLRCVAILLTTAAFALTPTTERAQAQPNNQGPKAEPPKPEPPKVEQPKDVNDPTSASQKLKDALFPPKVGKTQSGPAAVPKAAAIVLRGRVISKAGAAALIEFNGRMITVSKGSSFSNGTGVTYVINEVNSQEVRIDVLPLKESIILR